MTQNAIGNVSHKCKTLMIINNAFINLISFDNKNLVINRTR